MRSADITIFLIFPLFFCINTANAQFNGNHIFSIQGNEGAPSCQLSLWESKSPPDTSELKVPHLALEVGAGWVSGGRIGILTRVDKHWSAEFSYGYDIQNFYGGGNPNNRYGLGLNWHFSSNDTASAGSFGQDAGQATVS